MEVVQAGTVDVLEAERSHAAPSVLVVALFAATLFLSAFLLFLLEPMIAKMVLPVLGGTPMVWNTCVLFFQITLLAGYAYAHGATSWMPAKRQTIAYAAILLIPLVVLPFALRGAADPPAQGNPIPWLLGVLVRSVGLPFFALSTSASLLQKLFSQTGHRSARDPYFLYAASNTGSLLALLAYPTLVEPSFALGAQSRIWAIGFIAFAALALACAALARRVETATDAVESPDVPAVAWTRRAKWTVLAFIPSSLMLAVTSYLATDIAAVPLMWVVPLALYLLTFIAAFGSHADRWRAIADRRLPMLVVALVVFMVVHVTGPAWLVVPVHIGAFTLAALLCHCELAKDRPAPAQLTEFYFWMSFGGMLGGLFNTLVAPLAFSSILEYPLALLAACFVRVGTGRPAIRMRDQFIEAAMPVAIGALTVAMVVAVHRAGGSPRLAFFVPGLMVFSQMKYARRFAASLTALLVAGTLTPNANADGTVLHRERTFFGVYRVSLDQTERYRTLFHGTTLHGVQALDPARAGEPLTYFHRTGPFGQAFEQLTHASHAPRIGVVGLGVGTLAAYARPQQRWTFYEIDPAVERIARAPNGFTFLRDCGSRCRVVLGDARLSLAREDAQFGVFVLDAFSSDAIPVHLMTSEALSLYLQRLAPDGILAFHISNRHLRLAPILGRLAMAHGLVALEQKDDVGEGMRADGKASSNWVVMARTRSDLGPLLDDRRWAPPAVPADTPLWTDSFSNILGVFAIGR